MKLKLIGECNGDRKRHQPRSYRSTTSPILFHMLPFRPPGPGSHGKKWRLDFFRHPLRNQNTEDKNGFLQTIQPHNKGQRITLSSTSQYQWSRLVFLFSIQNGLFYFFYTSGPSNLLVTFIYGFPRLDIGTSAGYRNICSTERLGCIAIVVKSGYCIYIFYSTVNDQPSPNINTLRLRGKGTLSCKNPLWP